MKKVLVASILGMALSVASSYGQGYIIMQSYAYVGTTPVYSGITFGSGPLAGQYVGDEFSIELLYGGTSPGGTFSVVSGSLAPIYAGATDGGTPTSNGAGVVVGGPTVVLPGYAAGDTAYLEVEAVNGADTYVGTSAVFAVGGVQTSTLLPAGDLLDRGGVDDAETGTTVDGLQPFSVVPTPEPSVFALSSIGAAALMLIRRKKVC